MSWGRRFWSKEPIVLVLSRPQCARRPGTGGFGFTPLTKTQSPPCCVEVHDAQRPSQAFKFGGGGEAATTLANNSMEATTRVFNNF